MLVIVIWIICMIVAMIVADTKNRSGLWWGAATLFLSPLALLILFCLPENGDKCKECGGIIPSDVKKCKHCGSAVK